MFIVLSPRCLPAVAMSKKSIELQMSVHESSKKSKKLVPLFFRELKLKVINFFESHHTLVHGVDRENKFCRVRVEMSQLSTTHVPGTFCQNRSVQPEIEKMRFFVEISLIINLVTVKCILLRCTRFQPKL